MGLQQHKRLPLLFLAGWTFFFTTALPCPGEEIKTRYTTITWDSMDSLQTFNHKLYMGRLKYLLKGKKIETLEDEVRHKIDLIVEKNETTLDMYPSKLAFKIVITPTKKGVSSHFLRIYKKKVNYIAFYSPGENTVFFSANTASLRVVAHEFGHVIAENYFAISPPPKVHEVLAQYAEKNITK